MIIGVDGNEANVEKRVGVGEYAFELLRQFYNLQFTIYNLQFLIYLKNKPREDLPAETEKWQYKIVGPKRFWTQVGLPLALFWERPRPDVFFTPTHYAPRFCPIPTVIAVMDLSYLSFPQLFKKKDLYQLKNWTAYSVRKAKKILTISKATKNDIIKYYQVLPEKVVVTYPGYRNKFQMSNFKFQMDKIRKKYGIGGDYILFVGTLQPRKNLVRLIEAFAIFKTLNPKPYTLVIVGKPGWLYKEIYEAPKKFGVGDRVKFLDYVPDEELPGLYQNAVCFVLPSLYEGFGLPILEAMAAGCPVVTSNVSSLPEAAGEAAIYVDPQSPQSIAQGILKVLNLSPQQREELIKKGYEQVKKFSWEKTARETLKVLKEVATK